MDSGTVWGIVGVLVTIIISVLIYYLQRIKRYPAQLSYSLLSHLLLVQRLPTLFKDLKLKYDEYSVDNNLLFIRFIVFNDKSSDICADKEPMAIQISLSNDSKWVDIRISSESEQVHGSITINQEKQCEALLSFPLMKKDEFVVIEGLVEIESILSSFYPDNKFISFHHRIPNLDVFKSVDCISLKQYKKSKHFITKSIIWLSAILLLFFMQFIFPGNSRIRYAKKGSEDLFNASVNKNNEVVIDGKTLRHEAILPPNMFESQYTPVYKYNYSPLFRFNIILYGILLLLYFFIIWSEYKDIRRYKKIQKYLTYSGKG